MPRTYCELRRVEFAELLFVSCRQTLRDCGDQVRYGIRFACEVASKVAQVVEQLPLLQLLQLQSSAMSSSWL